ncbi:MAG: hypothetical protein HZA89_00920 [Verrucomicrobia bacterium]|nr:hypothetical protein [Verrucomicrobiota bacterium]
MSLGFLLAGLALYLAAGRVIVRRCRGGGRDALFALLNIGAVYALYYPLGHLKSAALFVAYLALVTAQFLILRVCVAKKSGVIWAAFAAPLVALAVIKYLPALVDPVQLLLGRKSDRALAELFVGISYLAFRSSYLVLEVRNGVIPAPTFWQYLGFCFFAPTMAVGPINAYGKFRRSLEGAPATAPPAGRAALRLLVGAIKYQFLAGLCNQLTYSGLLLDGHPHHWLDLFVAGAFYYLYLYCNFSGFCDMAIGAAGLLGITVEENFQNPFAARNVKDFWNRWHITLSTYMRDVVFTPLSKTLAGRFGPANAHHAIALAIAAVFLLVGVWHGLGWHFAAFGAMHALGVVVNHYYTLGLKKRLGKERFKTYNQSVWIRAVAVGTTFVYVAASFFLFANDFDAMRQIIASLRWN